MKNTVSLCKTETQPGASDLAALFPAMHRAGLGTGFDAIMHAHAGYRQTLAQARATGSIEQAPVRRRLVLQRVWTDAGLALCLQARALADTSGDAAADARRLLGLLAPVINAWPPFEPLLPAADGDGADAARRDALALDLLGHKVVDEEGRALQLLAGEMRLSLAAAVDIESVREFATAMETCLLDLVSTTRVLKAALARDAEAALANAGLYLEMFGRSVYAWVWLQLALAAARALPGSSGGERDLHQGQLASCRYFYRWELVKTGTQHALLRSLDASSSGMAAEWF